MNYRKKIDVDVITFPAGFDEEDRGLKTCCKKFVAFADLSSTDTEKNDKKGVKVALSDVSDSVTFVIKECGNDTPLTNLGDVAVFPQDSLAQGFIFDWKQYATTYGFGGYIISVEFTISGITGGYTVGQYDLQPFTIERAQGWTRIHALFNTYLNSDERGQAIDFTGSNFEDMLRVEGKFGERQTNTERTELISKGYTREKTKTTNPITYTWSTNPIGICSSRLILDLYFIGADVLLMTDHNKQSHSYLLQDIPTTVKEGESPTIEYYPMDRECKITQVLTETTINARSYYNVQ